MTAGTPPEIPADRPVVIERGNFMWVDDEGTLLCAPQWADGRPDLANIGEVMLDCIDEGDAARCERIRDALTALGMTP